MTDIVTLLTLPKTSQGFTVPRQTILDSEDDGSRSPPRKTARLDDDSASAFSSSRSLRRNEIHLRKAGRVRIQILGDSGQSEPTNYICYSTKV
jgi:hypothetical protein